MTDFLLSRCWPLLASCAVKSLCVLALAGAVTLALRRSSAAARHLTWRLALVGLLLLPSFSALPAVWQVPLAPRALLVTPDAPVVTQGTPPHPPVSGGPREAGRWVPAPPELGAGGPPSVPWPVWALGLWLIGFVLTLLPSLIGLAGVKRLARRCSPVPSCPLQDLMTSLAKDLSVTTPLRLLMGEAGTPMTWGWRRPVILLPTGADAWPEDRLRAVLLHELAHVARADWPAQMASHLACALYWFNPAVWLAARQARIESERACDDRVLLAGIPAPDYARHLLDVARALRDSPLPAALPMVRPSQIEARLRAILHPKRRTAMLTCKTVTLTALATLVVIVSLAVLRPVAQAKPINVTEVNTLSAPGVEVVDGVKVQLAGVTDARAIPGAKNVWWGPSGVVLPSPLINKIYRRSPFFINYYDPHTNSYRQRIGERPCQYCALAFKIASPDKKPVTIEFHPTLSLSSGSLGFWPGKLAGQAQATESRIDAASGGFRVLDVTYPPDATVFNVRIGIGTGQWHTMDVSSRFGKTNGLDAAAWVISPLSRVGDGSTVTVSYSKDEDPEHPSTDMRVVAMDAAGQEHLPTGVGDKSFGTLDQIQARFALPPSAITSVRLETRPFHWMTFRNVPLRPHS